MKAYIPKKLLIGIILYLLVGVLVGLWVWYDESIDDVGIGQRCRILSECLYGNAYLLPASVVIWPLFSISNPLIVAVALLIVFGLIWILFRRQTSGSSNPSQ